jgi:hypothetical protein
MPVRPRSRPVAFAAALALSLAAAAPAFSATILIDGNPGPTVPINTHPPRPVNPPGAARVGPGYLVVNVDNLSLRSGPDASFSLVGVIDGGTELIPLGSDGALGDERWWFVEVGGLRGWVKNEFVVIRGDLRGLPQVEARGEIAQPVLYMGGLNPLYPSRTGQPICLVGGDLFFRVLGVDAEEPSWVQIEAACGGRTVTGWVQADRGLLRNPGDVAIPVVPF